MAYRDILVTKTKTKIKTKTYFKTKMNEQFRKVDLIFDYIKIIKLRISISIKLSS